MTPATVPVAQRLGHLTVEQAHLTEQLRIAEPGARDALVRQHREVTVQLLNCEIALLQARLARTSAAAHTDARRQSTCHTLATGLATLQRKRDQAIRRRNDDESAPRWRRGMQHLVASIGRS